MSTAPVVTPEEAEELLGEFDLDSVSLREVYQRGCARWGCRPNRDVVSALPASLGAYEVVDSLDFSRCYLGAGGAGPILPIAVACERLRSLSLRGCGIRRDAALSFAEAAARHPTLTALDVGGNELGTTAGTALLRLCERNRRIARVGVADALVIPALQRRIERRTALNAEVADTLPPGAFRYIPARREDAAEPDPEALAAEREARERREAERQRLLDALPYWAPAACSEFAAALHDHRHHMKDLLSLFAPAPGLDDAACAPAELARVLAVLGCRFARAGAAAEDAEDAAKRAALREDGGGEPRAEAFAALLGCLRGGRVYHGELIALFRTHARVVGSRAWPADGPTGAPEQAVLDEVYDSRETLRAAAASLDVAGDGGVPRDELLAGLSALRVRGAQGELPRAQVEAAADALLTAAGVAPAADAAARYAEVFDALEAGDRPAMQWTGLTAGELRALRARMGHGTRWEEEERRAEAARRPRVGDRVVLRAVAARSRWAQDERHWGVLRDSAEGLVIADDGTDCVPLRVERAGLSDLYNVQDLAVLGRSDEPSEP